MMRAVPMESVRLRTAARTKLARCTLSSNRYDLKRCYCAHPDESHDRVHDGRMRYSQRRPESQN